MPSFYLIFRPSSSTGDCDWSWTACVHTRPGHQHSNNNIYMAHRSMRTIRGISLGTIYTIIVVSWSGLHYMPSPPVHILKKKNTESSDIYQPPPPVHYPPTSTALFIYNSYHYHNDNHRQSQQPPPAIFKQTALDCSPTTPSTATPTVGSSHSDPYTAPTHN